MCVLGTRMSCAKTDEPIVSRSGGPTLVGPIRNHALVGSARWRHPANTIERFVRGSDATLCYITLTACNYHYYIKKIFIHRETVAKQKKTAIYKHKYKQNESLTLPFHFLINCQSCHFAWAIRDTPKIR